MPKKRLLQGIDPDGHEFDVVQDANGYIIKCGHQKRISIRLSSKTAAADINEVLVHSKIRSYSAIKSSALVSSVHESSNFDKIENAQPPNRRTAEDIAVEEGQEFAGDVGAKRSREIPQLFTYTPEELGCHAAINRDHDAERRLRKENKCLREEREASILELREERDQLASIVQDQEETLRGILECVFFHLGGTKSLDARPVLEQIEAEYPDISSILDDLEEYEIESAKQTLEVPGSFSILAYQRGLVMSKKEYAIFRMREVASLISAEVEHFRQVTALSEKSKSLEDELRSRNLALRSLKGMVQKLKKKIPGGLSSWICRRPQAPPPHEYPQSTRSRHVRELEKLLLEVTNFDKEKQMFVVKAIFDKYGHPSYEAAAAAARVEDEAAVKACIFEAIRDAVALVKCEGRPTNHLRAVRQLLLTVASARLTPHLRSVAGNMLRIDPSILRCYQNSLEDLTSGKRSEWFSLRGKIRSTGLFSRTSVASLDAAILHWEATAVPSANKKDTCRNPDNSKECSLVLYNFEPLDVKHKSFLELQRAHQRVAWVEEGRRIFERASPGSVVVVSLFSRQRPFYELLEILSTEAPITKAALDPSIRRIVTDDDFDLWILGRIVTRGSHPLRLVRTEELAAAPVTALRQIIQKGGEVGVWGLERKSNGIFEQSSRVFNMALGTFRAVKPYYIKKGSRETCLCVYHLRWDFLIEGLRRYYQKLHRRVPVQNNAGDEDLADSSTDEELAEEQAKSLLALLNRPADLRSTLVCAQSNGRLSPACLEGICPRCRNFQKVKEVFKGSGLLPEGVLPNSSNGQDELSDDENVDSGLGIDEEEHEELINSENMEARSRTTPFEPEEGDDSLIEYDKWEGRPARLADGTFKNKFDFFTVQVPLKVYWDDFSKFFMPFVQHHDLNKDCREAWDSLQHNFRRGEVVLVMDAAEAKKHERRRQHQSAYFQHVSSHIWVVVIYLHVEDLGNISDEEKQKLLDFFHGLGKRPVVRETHFFITQDVEIKDQGGVQHVLRFIMEYVQGRGKWARANECASCGVSLPVASDAFNNKCPTCGGIANFFEQEHLDPFEKEDRQYYQGNGAPAPGIVFQWVKAFSDGSSQQFMNATFLFFLSLFSTLFGICVIWNWFCSCHGKCVCDPEGGSLKAAADAYESQDSPLGDQRRVIRDAREFVLFGRAQLGTPSSRDFFSKGGTGVFRRYFHYVPVNGRGAVNRRLVKKAESGLHLKGTMEKVKTRSIRRVAGSGFPGLLWASKRPCCSYTCYCMGGGAEGRHDFSRCETSSYTKCFEIQLEPVSAVSPTPTTRGALALVAARLGAEASVGDILATETESDETPFMLVMVTKMQADVPENYESPPLGIEFNFPVGVKAIEVRRFCPAITARGESSNSFFELDETTAPFLVPCHLLRVGKLELSRVDAAPSRNLRGGRGARGAARYEISPAIKAKVYELCRIFD